jgi:hypothetical protein
MHSPHVPSYLILLRPKYPPEHLIYKHPLDHVPPSMWQFCTHINYKQNYSSVYFNLHIFWYQTGNSISLHNWDALCVFLCNLSMMFCMFNES